MLDIDGTICSNTDGNYEIAEPFKDRIEKINQLYDDGNSILFFTARGSTTKINWKKLTEDQLQEWGVKYTKLIFGKPEADIYIDDKAVDVEEFFLENI